MIVTNPVSGNNNNMKKKSSQGRKKIEIKKIEEVNNRQVTFSKRRAGLFKKASELCILTGAQIAILVNSPGGRVFAFGHPTADALIDRYLTTTTTGGAAANGSTSEGTSTSHQKPLMVKEFNQHYVEVSKELEAEKKRKEVIQELKMMNGGGVVGGGGGGLAWYDEAIDELDVDELQQYLESLGELKKKVVMRADDLTMIKKAPTLLGPNMLDMGHPNHIQNIEIVPSNIMGQVGFGFGPAMDYQPRYAADN